VDNVTVPEAMATDRVGGVHAVNLAAKLVQIDKHWSPKTVATLNDYDVRLVKVQGEFVRHQHDDSDEFFLVLNGELTLRLDDGDVTLGPGDLYVVPRGVHHQPYAANEAELMLIEPRHIVNTGDAGGPLTATREEI
jgi:mannose-6-phosphate isomerase-like protein (cupin superfamily)